MHGRRNRAAARERFVEPLLAHAAAAGGHLFELADAEPPHTPRGCPFQAWSVGEALRLCLDVLADAGPSRRRGGRPEPARLAARPRPASASASRPARARRQRPATARPSWRWLRSVRLVGSWSSKVPAPAEPAPLRAVTWTYARAPSQAGGNR